MDVYAYYIQSQILSNFRKRVCKISTSETKIILVLCYYAVYGVMYLTYVSMEFALPDATYQAIEQYYVCESVGSGKQCDRSTFDFSEIYFLYSASYMFFAFVPAVNLMFVMNWTAVKEPCQHVWMICSQRKFVTPTDTTALS